MASNPRTYREVLSSYTGFVTFLLLAITVVSVMAFPYYISPLTYQRGNQPQGEADLILFVMITLVALLGVYFLDKGTVELGFAFIIVGVLFGLLLIWSIYGVSAVRQLPILT